MIRKIAWDTFKNTGDINAFLELKQIENLEKQLNNQIDIQEVQKNTNMNLEDFNR
ncbi:MAG: YqzL family protein [Clostridia bacterium]